MIKNISVEVGQVSGCCMREAMTTDPAWS